MTQHDLATSTSVSVATVRKLEQGLQASYSPKTLARVAAALDWGVDAVEAIHNGDAPPPAAPDTRQRRAARVAHQLTFLPEHEVRAIERLVGELVTVAGARPPDPRMSLSE